METPKREACDPLNSKLLCTRYRCASADENSVCNIKTKAPAKLAKEVVTAHKIRASRERACEGRRIEANAFRSYACGQLSLRVFAERRGIHCVYVIEKWAKRLKTLVQVFACAECSVKAHAKVMVEKKIHTKRWIGSASNRGYCPSAGRARKPGNAKCKVKLLCMSGACRQKDQAKNRS